MPNFVHDSHYMQRALELAEQAKAQGEVPIGAVVVLNDKIIGEGFNQPIHLSDPTAHAEIIAMRDAAKNTGNYRLAGATLYVTLQPCAMCKAAMVHARIAKCIYAAKDSSNGSLNHSVAIVQGPLADRASQLLLEFFQLKR